MEVTGKIIAILQPKSGVSQKSGNAWYTQEFVIEIPGQYTRKMVFNIFGEDKVREANIRMGDDVTVHFDIDAHEYNGRWFNEIRAFKVQHDQPQAQYQQVQEQQPQPQPQYGAGGNPYVRDAGYTTQQAQPQTPLGQADQLPF